MFPKFMPMVLVLCLPHCSAEQPGQMTQVQSRRAFDGDLNQSSEVATVPDNTPRQPVEKVSSGVTQPSTPVAPTPVDYQPIVAVVEPSQNPAPTPREPAASPSAQPNSPVKPAETSETTAPYSVNPRSALPDVVIDSERALTPVTSLAAPAVKPNKSPPSIVATYRLESVPMPGVASNSLICTSINRLSTGDLQTDYFRCSLQDASGFPVTLQPADFSWKFVVRNCPGPIFWGNMDGDSCSLGDLSACSPVQPATRIDMYETDLDACVSLGAQLIYSLVDKKAGKTSVQVLNLQKSGMP